MAMNIVLVEPEIPQNTGNIARTCAATGAMLHLVKPLGFSLDDRYMRRAGLDYWFLMRYAVYEDLEDFFRKNGTERCWLASTKAACCYSEVTYRDGDFLLFGRESRGLPESLLARMPDALRGAGAAPAEAEEEPDPREESLGAATDWLDASTGSSFTSPPTEPQRFTRRGNPLRTPTGTPFMLRVSTRHTAHTPPSSAAYSTAGT